MHNSPTLAHFWVDHGKCPISNCMVPYRMLHILVCIWSVFSLHGIFVSACGDCSAAGFFFLTEPGKMQEKNSRLPGPHRTTIQGAEGDSGEYNNFSESSKKESTEREPLIQKRNKSSSRSPVPLYGPTSSEDSLEVKQRQESHTCIMSCVSCCTNCQKHCTLQNIKHLAQKKSKAALVKAKETLTVLQDRRVLICTILYGMLAFIGALCNQVTHPVYSANQIKEVKWSLKWISLGLIAGRA